MCFILEFRSYKDVLFESSRTLDKIFEKKSSVSSTLFLFNFRVPPAVMNDIDRSRWKLGWETRDSRSFFTFETIVSKIQ